MQKSPTIKAETAITKIQARKPQYHLPNPNESPPKTATTYIPSAEKNTKESESPMPTPPNIPLSPEQQTT